MDIVFDSFLIAQIIGFIALAISTVSFQIKDQKLCFLWVEVSNIVWIVHYILLGGYTAAFGIGIGVFRTLTVLYKPQFKIHAIIPCLMATFAFCFISPEEYWYKFIPFFAAVFYSLSLFKNEQYLLSRILVIVTMSCWFVYGLFIHSYPEVIESSFIIISILIGIWRHKDK